MTCHGWKKYMGLFLAVLGLFGVNAEHGGDVKLENDKPLSMIQGEYQISAKTDMNHYRPTWASVWQVEHAKDINNGMFYVSVWPPKYCHAVYVCPFAAQDYNAVTNFKTEEEDICEKEYIKFYPHAKKLLLKSLNGEEVLKYWVKNRLEFEINEEYQSIVHAYSQKPETVAESVDEGLKDNRFTIDLKGKHLLILTNSRMCQVNKIGTTFGSIFQSGIQNDTTGMYPKWLQINGDFVQSDYLPSIKKTTNEKNIDLLAYLRAKTWSNKPLGNSKKSCQPVAGWKSAGRKKKEEGKFQYVSVNSYDVNVENSQNNNVSLRTFSLNIENCHWFRLWFTEKNGMADYNTTLNLGETIDFFIKEGFYITPESDMAIPLPGVTETNKFTFTVPHIDPKKGYVDMTYGELLETPIYHDQFILKTATEQSFKLHIIKAPHCEISLDSRSTTWTDSTVSQFYNFWGFDACKFSYFK
uniref:Secreted protein n=1 Tax=Caenorhabditis tropicalis TaxID=1561998 RepID=A0A1I7T753_9PELO